MVDKRPSHILYTDMGSHLSRYSDGHAKQWLNSKFVLTGLPGESEHCELLHPGARNLGRLPHNPQTWTDSVHAHFAYGLVGTRDVLLSHRTRTVPRRRFVCTGRDEQMLRSFCQEKVSSERGPSLHSDHTQKVSRQPQKAHQDPSKTAQMRFYHLVLGQRQPIAAG